MHKQIYVNLAVSDRPRLRVFFESLGLHFNPQFSNDQGARLVAGDNVCAMLLTRDFFKTFTDKSLCDAKTSCEVLVCLSCESRAEVDALVAKAVAAGGRTPRPAQDHGFVYRHRFEGLDGHVRELRRMDANASAA